MTPEGKVKKKIKALLDSYGERVYVFMPVPSGYGKTTVDYLICFDGLFIAIEAKAGGKPATSRQEDVLKQVHDAGGSSFVVDDDDSLQTLANFLLTITLKIPV
jgi:uncharacterized protein YgbK (DUF1537 family)